MNFSLLKVDNPVKLKSLSKNKTNFFKKEKEEIAVFHFNKIDNDLFHTVFNISDEYQVSTKKLGNQHNFTYSSLVNFFFIMDAEYSFLEYINKEYQKEVLDEIKRRTKSPVSIHTLNNESMMKIYKDLGGTIKKISYTNVDDEFFDFEFVTDVDLNKIVNEDTIEGITLLVEGQYISFSKEGRISVDNSHEDYLINFTKRIIHAVS